MTANLVPNAPLGPLDPIAAQIAGFFQIDPVWQGLMTRPVAETRAAIKAGTPPGAPRELHHVEDFSVPVAGGDIGLRLYVPAPGPSALVVWAHGGGFALGSIEESDGFARALAIATGCAIALVDYRLAPEHRFPTAVEDLLGATLWVAERQVDLAGAVVPLFLGGDSAGANLATVVTRKLHEAKACSIAGNILAYPCTDNEEAPSLRAFEPPFLKLEEVLWLFDQYLPDRAARSSLDFAPLHATNLALLPPTIIITAEHDIITGQAEAYGSKLQAEGVDVQVTRYAGMIHGFLTLEFFFAGAAGEGMREISEFIKRTQAKTKAVE